MGSYESSCVLDSVGLGGVGATSSTRKFDALALVSMIVESIFDVLDSEADALSI